MAEVKYTVIEGQKKNVILREFYGDVKVADVTESFLHIFREYEELNITGVITDFSQANFLISLKEFPKVLDFISKNREIFKLKLAVIAQTPKQTTFPVLAKARLKLLPIKAFSTMKAALDWMNED